MECLQLEGDVASQSIYQHLKTQPNRSASNQKMSTYKPTEHDGLKEDGTPDKRVGTGEFAHGKVDPHEAGKQGGQTGGSTTESNTSGSNNSGSNSGSFAHGKVDPREAGKKGGKTSGSSGSDEY